MIGYDGTYTNDDYPGAMKELTGPPPPKRRGFTWTPPVDAMDRETYLRIGRPLLLAAGFLTPVAAEKVPLPPMPDTRKRRAPAKPKPVPVVKPAAPPQEEAPF
jgi:hypothetical protein